MVGVGAAVKALLPPLYLKAVVLQLVAVFLY